MNPLLTVNSTCRVYFFDPKVEGDDVYIEGLIKSIDNREGVYVVQCTKDCTMSESFKAREPAMANLTREGTIIRVPIAPESGDFAGRIKLI